MAKVPRVVKWGMHGEGGACMAKGDMHGRGECTWHEGSCMVGVACVAGGMRSRGGAYVAGDTVTAAHGTHPTGMHSCLARVF